MTPAELHRALCEQARYAAMPMRFEVDLPRPGEVEVSLFLTTLDPDSGEVITQRSRVRHALVSLETMHEDAVIQWVFSTLVRVAFLHEAGEMFLWNKKRPMDPHAKVPR